MQERPNKLVLLTAIARFLNEEARPALADPRLAFRALIAANLASIVASEMMSDDDHLMSELTRLRALFRETEGQDEKGQDPKGPDAAGAPIPERTDARRAAVLELNTRLARALRAAAGADAGALDQASVAAHLRATLRDKLAVDNPRFDTARVIE
jgi:hypothetical protein